MLVDQAAPGSSPTCRWSPTRLMAMIFIFDSHCGSRGLAYGVAVERATKVWTSDHYHILESTSQPAGRARKFVPPASLSNPPDLAELMCARPTKWWQKAAWRTDSQGPLRSRLAMMKVWADHGWQARFHLSEWLSGWHT